MRYILDPIIILEIAATKAVANPVKNTRFIILSFNCRVSEKI
jgi:hypothetical protein